MAAQPGADLLLALSQLRGTPLGVYSTSTFTVPDPAHGCIAGKKVRQCATCGGHGHVPRTGRADGGACPACLGNGFQTASCAICALYLNDALDFRDRVQRPDDNDGVAFVVEGLAAVSVDDERAEVGEQKAGDRMQQQQKQKLEEKEERLAQKKESAKKVRGAKGGYVAPPSAGRKRDRRWSGSSGGSTCGSMVKRPDTPVH